MMTSDRDRTVLRVITETDVPDAHALTASFGWAYRKADWALALASGDGIAAEQDGKLVGTAMRWRFGERWATMGLITVATSAQGQGLGRRMMLALIPEIDSHAIALHATQAGIKLYASLGFEPTGTIAQHQGLAADPGSVSLPPDTELRPVVPASLPELIPLDRAACGMDRTRLLSVLLPVSSGVIIEQNGQAVGFALARPFGYGELIGPVIAPELRHARAMVAHLLAYRTGQFVRIDISMSSGLGPWLTGVGLSEVEVAVRMVRSADGVTPTPTGIFGLASQSFG